MRKPFTPRIVARRVRHTGPEAELARILVTELTGGNPAEVVFDGENATAYTDAKRLIELGKVAHRWAELACNGVEYFDHKLQRRLQKWDDEDEANKEKADTQVLQESMTIMQRYGGLNVKLQGDPRGVALRLYLKSGRYNTWGGKEGGWGV